MNNRRQSKTVTLVGSGNLAHAMAVILPRAGYRISEIVVRSNSTRARELGRKTGLPVRTIANASWSGNILWMAVSDGAIRGLASDLARLMSWKEKVVLHSSGALSSRELLPLGRRGAHVASAHPMMTFVPGELPGMNGVVWTIEGEPAAMNVARQIITATKGRALVIDPKQKPLYHAFGAFLSPLLVVHLDTAAEMALKVGIPRRDLGRLMKPIVEKTLSNLLANIDRPRGAEKAFSGPLIRGDVETIRKHLESLRRLGRTRHLYAALVLSAINSGLPIRNRRAIARLIRTMA